MEFILEITRRTPRKPLDRNWRDRAACINADVEDFFPPTPVDTALRYCHQCPVTRECLAFADAHDAQGFINATYGVFGGLTAEQRRYWRNRKERLGGLRAEYLPLSLF